MNIPNIQFGSSTRKQVMDDKTLLITKTKYHSGKGVATNRLSHRDRLDGNEIPISEVEARIDAVLRDKTKLEPSFSLVRHSSGIGYDIIVEYTILEME